MNITVAHLVPALFDANDGILGGAERYALELARNMSSVVPTRLLTFGSRAREESIDRLKITVLGNASYIRGQQTNPFDFGMFRELKKASVVHCFQQHVLASSLAAAYCRITGRKVFVSDLGGGGWDISAFLSTDNWFHGHLHLSEYSKKVFGHSSRSSAHVILGGVDTAKFSPHSHQERTKTILYVGRILPHKGIEYLIQAVNPETSVEIVGKSYDERYLQDLKSLASGKNILFTGPCTEDELVQKYRKSLCLVLPSVYRTMYGDKTSVPELLGQTLLESMSCGTTVICTDVGAMPQFVENDVTGYIVPPNDPESLRERLNRFLNDPGKASEMGHAGRNFVLQNYQWTSVVDRCLKIYAGDHG